MLIDSTRTGWLWLSHDEPQTPHLDQRGVVVGICVQGIKTQNAKTFTHLESFGVLFLHLLLPLQFVLPTEQLADLLIALPGHFLLDDITSDGGGGSVIVVTTVIVTGICTITIASTVGAIIVVVIVVTAIFTLLPTFTVTTGGVVVVILLAFYVLIVFRIFTTQGLLPLALILRTFGFFVIFPTDLLMLLGLTFALVFAEALQKDLRVARLNEKMIKNTTRLVSWQA